MPDIVAAYSAFVHGLPPVAQPVVRAFTWSLPCWTAIAIFERHWLVNHAPTLAKKLSGWLALALGGGLFYLRDRFPQVRAVLDYPDRHWRAWHLHWWQMLIGCLVAGFVAKLLGALYAGVFLRPRSRGNQGGAGGFPPGWEGQSRFINWHSEWEDE